MEYAVVAIIFVAFFIQSLTGFGSALLAMPFLLTFLAPEVARPSFILVGQTAGLLFMWQYRSEWRFPDIKTTLIGSLIGIPVGTWVENSMEQNTFMLVLGILLVCYALYALIGFKLPPVHEGWGAFFGFLSGILHSAYNVGGPPLVMYNSSHDWEARRFKGNTQAIFFVMGLFVIFEHFRAGNMTTVVFQNYLLMIPAMAMALFLGFRAEKFIKQDIFRKMVMVLLLIIGFKLLF